MRSHWIASLALVAASIAVSTPTAAQSSTLPIVAVPATPPSATPLFALLLSGDGGWATIDEGLAAALAQAGIPVVGLNSLRYFWRERTPQELADDLAALLEEFGQQWGKTEILAIGYSQGADVLPFALNRLPAPVRARIGRVVLLAPSEKATFEFHWLAWLGKDTGEVPVAPELLALERTQVLCVYGDADRESLCRSFDGPYIERRMLHGNHRFDGDFERIAAEVLGWLASGATSSAAP